MLPRPAVTAGKQEFEMEHWSPVVPPACTGTCELHGTLLLAQESLGFQQVASALI